MLYLKHLEEHHWEDAVVKASCPKCNKSLNWKVVGLAGEIGLLELRAECCGYWWKLMPSKGWIESNYENK